MEESRGCAVLRVVKDSLMQAQGEVAAGGSDGAIAPPLVVDQVSQLVSDSEGQEEGAEKNLALAAGPKSCDVKEAKQERNS